MRTLNPKMATTKRKQPASSNITSFFSPAPKRRAPEEHSVSADNSMQLPRDSMGQETRPPRPETEVATKPAQIADPFSSLDIADFVSASSLSVPDQGKYRVIKERKPSLHESIPSKSYKDCKRKSGTYQRRCNREWFEIFDFLAYSSSTQGLFCLACVLFPTSSAHQGASRAQYLVTKPYQNWKDGKADLMAHTHLHYHQGAEAKLKAFVSTMENPSL